MIDYNKTNYEAMLGNITDSNTDEHKYKGKSSCISQCTGCMCNCRCSCSESKTEDFEWEVL